MNEFQRQYLCDFYIDPEYNAIFDLWVEYWKKTYDMPRSMNKEAMAVHESLFNGIAKDHKYYMAKRESLRFYVRSIHKPTDGGPGL